MCMVLHQHDHGHGHGHSHGHSHGIVNNEERDVDSASEETSGQQRRQKGKKERRNINVRAAFIHVIGDLVQSVGVLIAGYIIKFWVCLELQSACVGLAMCTVYTCNIFFCCTVQV